MRKKVPETDVTDKQFLYDGKKINNNDFVLSQTFVSLYFIRYRRKTYKLLRAHYIADVINV